MAFALLLLGAGYTPGAPPARRAPAERCAPSRMIEYLIDTDVKELLTFERLVRVKPYPAACPFGGIELFGAAQPLRLQPAPPRATSATLERFYRELFGDASDLAVLEHTCDGRSRLPKPRWLPKRRRRGASQLHACVGSYEAALARAPRLAHAPMPPLAMESALRRRGGTDGSWLSRSTDGATLSYTLPYADNSFDAVASHACVPYAEAPLPLFAELFRVLRPGGRLCVTFHAPRRKEAERDERHAGRATSGAGGERDGADGADGAGGAGGAVSGSHPGCDERSAALAWLTAADAADLLYMVGSFFYYAAEWRSLEVRELHPRSASAAGPLYAMVATKPSERAAQVARATEDVQRSRWEKSGGSAPFASAPATAAAEPSVAAQLAKRAEAADRDEAARKLVERSAARAAAAAAAREAEQPAARAVTAGEGAPPPEPASGAGTPAGGSTLADGLRRAKPGKPAPRGASGYEATARKLRKGGVAAGTASPTEDSKERVRNKVLDQIKKGIARSRERTDLAEGERKMLDHMQLYVRETKAAEGALADDDRALWEEMKAEQRR